MAAPAADQPRPRRTLLWRLFAATAPVVVLAAAVLIITPISISDDPVLAEALALGAGVAIMLAVHLVLMRRTLAPLRELAERIGGLDPARTGQRLRTAPGATREVAALAAAFNGLLARIDAERQRSARRALAAQEDERLRIAREIHDQVGQVLTAAAIQAERAVELSGPEARPVADGVARAVHQGLEDVRRIGRELRPESLDDLGLGNALITLCRRLSRHGSVRVSPRLAPGVPTLDPDRELVIYRVAQEAITNALRHSGAERVELRLQAGERVELSVADDGRGMPAELPADTAGIAGMRERAELVGGRLELRSAPGEGTEVRLSVPLPQGAGR